MRGPPGWQYSEISVKTCVQETEELFTAGLTTQPMGVEAQTSCGATNSKKLKEK